MNSLHKNIITPASEHIVPSHSLDKKNGHSDFAATADPEAKNIKWQAFAKDLVVWFIALFIFYIFFKLFFKKDNK
jgi:hypothetical protein